MKTKIDIVLELVRQGKVTNEEAKILMTTEKEFVYLPYSAPTIWPYNPMWPTITYCGDSNHATTGNELIINTVLN